MVNPISRGHHGRPLSPTPASSSRLNCNPGNPPHQQNGRNHRHDSAATPLAGCVGGAGQAGTAEGNVEQNQAGETGATRRRLGEGGMFDNVEVPVQTVSGDGSYTAVLVVPTGIGAAIGGYAGDALPVAR